MNWLAHLRLGGTDPLERLGNLAGDFVRGCDLTELPVTVRLGIASHRAIDRFTDAHPAHRRSCRRLPPALRRVAGALVDVFYDHHLARHWPRLGDGAPLEEFAQRVHSELLEHRAALPPQLRAAAARPGFRLADWLAGYVELAGVREVLARMEARRAHPRIRLLPGVPVLAAHHAAFEADFLELWPALTDFVAAQRAGG